MNPLTVSLVSSVSTLLTRRGVNRGQSCMKKEVWKPVDGTNGRYRVSNLGRLFSVKRNRVLSPSVNNSGYHSTTIYYDKNNIKSMRVHRLVAFAFIPNPNNKPFINHINGIKTDNRIENLEWVTMQENAIHATRTGLNIPPKGTKHGRSKLNEQLVKRMRKERKQGKTYTQFADEYGVDRKTAWAAVVGKNWSHI